MDGSLSESFKKDINRLASNLYRVSGWVAEEDYDFSTSSRGGEQLCWNQAIVAYAFIERDNTLLKHQVDLPIRFC